MQNVFMTIAFYRKHRESGVTHAEAATILMRFVENIAKQLMLQ